LNRSRLYSSASNLETRKKLEILFWEARPKIERVLRSRAGQRSERAWARIISAEELIRGCTEANDPAAWDEFVARCQRPTCMSIIGIAVQWDVNAQQLVEDLAQGMCLKFAPN
jgi:hypothetical protein